MIGHLVLVAGAVSAALLIAALIAGIGSPRWRVWPAPPAGSARSLAFWTLFRVLNAAVLLRAGVMLFTRFEHGHAGPARYALTAAAIAAFAIYLYALLALGKQATYCREARLETRGIYGWTRNPQYVTAIVAYLTLALATAEPATLMLASALALVYALMAVAEEPWLESVYGADYRRYRRDVPRFFNTRRLLLAARRRTWRPSPRRRV